MVVVHTADVQDRDGAELVPRRAKALKRWPRVVFADGGYAGKLVGWVRRLWGVALRVVERSGTARGLEVLPERWVVGRAPGWPGNHRRLSKGYEPRQQRAEAAVKLAMLHVMLRRLAPPKANRRSRSPG